MITLILTFSVLQACSTSSQLRNGHQHERLQKRMDSILGVPSAVTERSEPFVNKEQSQRQRKQKATRKKPSFMNIWIHPKYRENLPTGSGEYYQELIFPGKD